MSLRHAALGLLADRPGSGYDLLRRFDTTMRHVWNATQSQLYTELTRLERNGLVEVTAQGARGRKEYAVTDAGRAELDRWIVEESTPAVHDAELLKVFMLGRLDPADARALLDRREGRARAALAALHEVRDTTPWDDSPQDRAARISLEWGLRARQAEVEWAAWARAQIH